MRLSKWIGITACVAALAGLGVGSPRAEDKPAASEHGSHFVECAKACAACMIECESCARHCAQILAAGKAEHVKTLQSCADCAEFCASAAKVISRNGPMSMVLCAACAKACDICGATCEKFPDDEHMKRCAQECRKCEKACTDMLRHAEHAAK